MSWHDSEKKNWICKMIWKVCGMRGRQNLRATSRGMRCDYDGMMAMAITNQWPLWIFNMTINHINGNPEGPSPIHSLLPRVRPPINGLSYHLRSTNCFGQKSGGVALRGACLISRGSGHFGSSSSINAGILRGTPKCVIFCSNWKIRRNKMELLLIRRKRERGTLTPPLIANERVPPPRGRTTISQLILSSAAKGHWGPLAKTKGSRVAAGAGHWNARTLLAKKLLSAHFFWLFTP